MTRRSSTGDAQSPPRWIADSRNGCGVWNPEPKPSESITWSGGCVDRLAEGPGILQWYENGAKGDRYEGQFRAGRENGSGVLVTKEGLRFEGTFVDGKMNGRGVLTLPNGSRYEGALLHGRAGDPKTRNQFNGAV